MILFRNVSHRKQSMHSWHSLNSETLHKVQMFQKQQFGVNISGKIEGELSWERLPGSAESDLSGYKVLVNDTQIGNELPRTQYKFNFKVTFISDYKIMKRPLSYKKCLKFSRNLWKEKKLWKHMSTHFWTFDFVINLMQQKCPDFLKPKLANDFQVFKRKLQSFLINRLLKTSVLWFQKKNMKSLIMTPKIP